MTRDPIAVTPSTTVRDLARMMLDNEISGLPVVDASQPPSTCFARSASEAITITRHELARPCVTSAKQPRPSATHKGVITMPVQKKTTERQKERQPQQPQQRQHQPEQQKAQPQQKKQEPRR
jgi:predicted transcriptional regulator